MNVPAVEVGWTIEDDPLADTLMVEVGPLLILYVTTTGIACGLVIVIDGFSAFWHTCVCPAIDAVSTGRTVTMVLAEAVQPFLSVTVTE